MKIAILVFHLPLSLAVWNIYDHNYIIPPKTRGTGRTSTRRPDYTTRVLFQFEGVDYDLMPTNLHQKNNDCNAHFVWCIQNQTLMNPICAYDYRNGGLYDFYSPCEVELQNCKYRTTDYYYKSSQKGKDMRSDKFFYNGEGYNCKYYARMGGDPVEHYFAEGNRRRKLDHKKLTFDSFPYKKLI